MGTFAFGRDGHEAVVRDIANLRPFDRGGISGRRGSCHNLHRLPREYRHGLAEAHYVVYCYDTPIAWVTYAEGTGEDGRVNYMPDWQYSATTTYHQSLVTEAWGEDKLNDPNPRYSRAKNRGTQRGRSSDVRYGRAPMPDGYTLSGTRIVRAVNRPGRSVGAVPTDRPGSGRAEWRTNHRGVRYDATVERDTSYERDMAEARGSAPSRTAPSGPPAHLLDRRFSDPDWTPEPLPAGADQRDFERVENDMARDGGRRRAHP